MAKLSLYLSRYHSLLALVCLVCQLLLVSGTGFEGCRIRYGRRGCSDQVYTGVIVACDGNNAVTEIPTSIPEDTVYLSLVNFKFGRFQMDNFTKLRKVECLHIMDTDIHSIVPDAFNEMELLHEMEFKNTNLTSSDLSFINHPNFRGRLVSISGSPFVSTIQFNGTLALQKLKVVGLEDNKIGYINPSVLTNLMTVEELSLSNNELRSLDWMQMTDLPKLNKLYLDGNNIQTIPEYMINTFAAVKQLHLAGNPLHCNCKLRWLKDFYEITTDKLLDYDSVRCTSPFQRRMMDTVEEDFMCTAPATPKVEWIEVTPGKEYILNCSSVGDPAPMITLSFPDHKKLMTPPAEDISKLTTSSPRIVTGPGVITCSATNSEGTRVTETSIPFPDSGSFIKPSFVLLTCVIAFTSLLSSLH